MTLSVQNRCIILAKIIFRRSCFCLCRIYVEITVFPSEFNSILALKTTFTGVWEPNWEGWKAWKEGNLHVLRH